MSFNQKLLNATSKNYFSPNLFHKHLSSTPANMIERDEESNINEEISSYNPGRVQDGGYMNKVRNQIGVALMESINV
ncbi:hypothetical protein MTR_7g100090 [Medicago truncatula]|uniref:Uncharacterized protein n=1 Tax=Medicago truncatula TaxID=3880 RepID=G7L0M6_MEDTR|nr:hypothetical protein MTR_7g100090 [Medicago truncatula]